MRLLLDTHVVLWLFSGEREISALARQSIDRASTLIFSAVSFAEIGVKVSIGKLSVPSDLYQQVLDSGVELLPLQAHHGSAVADLPMHHRDPFDRLLIAQARAEDLTLVTADPRIKAYDVTVIDAG